MQLARCKKCFAIMRATVRACPRCGEVRTTVLVTERDGELREVSEEDLKAAKLEVQRKAWRTKRMRRYIAQGMPAWHARNRAWADYKARGEVML